MLIIFKVWIIKGTGCLNMSTQISCYLSSESAINAEHFVQGQLNLCFESELQIKPKQQAGAELCQLRLAAQLALSIKVK